jgi:membrane protein DedA with SNARE-associated domain
MEEFANDPVLQWFFSMAFEPWKVYLGCVTLLLLSSFGLPVPEEITLLSAGFMAYVGRSPEEFPPPHPGAAVVDPVFLAILCLLAVFLSDFLIYGLGRRFGERVRQSRLGRLASAASWNRAESWTERHGAKVCWIFRFTPGIRFPGHLTCGIVRVPLWQFCLADGIAALVSVPTQILLIAYYGDVVISFLKKFKFAVLVVVIVLAAAYVGFRLLRWRRESTEEAPEVEESP